MIQTFPFRTLFRQAAHPLVIPMNKKSSDDIIFGEWVRQRRHILDLTQQELADQVGCARITLRRIESGGLKPSKALAKILLEKLGVPSTEHETWLQFARGLSGFPGNSIDHSKSKPLTNLPASLTTFIGREKEQAEVIELIAKHRLVTLTGPGGVGKTRLSFKVAEKRLEKFADGVWLVELAPLLDPMFVPRTTAMAIGLRDERQRPLIDMLCNYLRQKKLLIILDNCEHLLDACAKLADILLKNCPSLKILVTSREPLGILGEAIYQVPSLRRPELQKLLNAFRDFESVKLFEERAQLAQFDFSLTPENAPSVAQICHRLDGIPLAIELAAAKIGTFSSEQIAKQLDDRFNLLTEGNRVALPRHQTLRASIDWSWGLLTESERILMRQLSVFAGGWTLEAAQMVCDGDVFKLTNTLVNKSLILVEHKQGWEPRYHMLDTIRAYTLEKLKDSGGTKIVFLRHLLFFTNLVEEAEKSFRGPDQAIWYHRLDNELNNLRIALTWLEKPENAELKLRLAAGLWRYWKNRGHSHEGREHLQRILENVSITPTRQASAYARALNAAGALAYYEGDFSYSEKSREEALEIFRALNNKPGIADCLNGLGNTSISQGHYDSARGFYREGLLIRKDLGDTWGVARLLGNLGLLAFFQTDYIQARAYHLESLSLFRELQDEEGAANELINLGDVVLSQGELMAAKSYYEESGRISKKLNDKWGFAYAIKGTADVAFRQNDFPAASALYRECLMLFQKTGDPIGLPFALESVAALAIVKDDQERAARILGAAETLRNSTNSPLPPPYRPGYQTNLNILRQQLSSERFNVAWSEGCFMTFNEVVAYALES